MQSKLKETAQLDQKYRQENTNQSKQKIWISIAVFRKGDRIYQIGRKVEERILRTERKEISENFEKRKIVKEK